MVYLQTVAFGELRIPCSKAAPLCGPSRPPLQAQLRVWLQDPGYLYSWWIVAAEHDGKSIITPESQASAYQETKIAWAVGTLVAIAVAFVLWHFAPFKESLRREA